MAAEVTLAEETFGVIKKIVWKWKSHTDGKVAVTTTGAKTGAIYNGEIVRIVTIPDGTAAPTDKYDVFVYDDDSGDVLMGEGKDRSSSDIEQVNASSLGVVANDRLTLYVENAGSGKKGTAVLYVR